MISVNAANQTGFCNTLRLTFGAPNVLEGTTRVNLIEIRVNKTYFKGVGRKEIIPLKWTNRLGIRSVSATIRNTLKYSFSGI